MRGAGRRRGIGERTTGASAAPPAAASSSTDAADATADPDCKPADIACAWTQCYPMNQAKFKSNTAISQSCKIKADACTPELAAGRGIPTARRPRDTGA